MGRLAVLLALLALAGCGGGDDEGTGDGASTDSGPVPTDSCLGEQGFSLRPAASGISAVSPSGVAFTVTFFDTEADAREAAGGAEGSTAVATAVVTPEGKRLTSPELATVEECVRGA